MRHVLAVTAAVAVTLAAAWLLTVALIRLCLTPSLALVTTIMEATP